MTVDEFDGPAHPVLGPNAFAQIRGAFPHALIAHGDLDGACQPLRREVPPGDGFRSDTQRTDSPSPEMLPTDKGNNHGRDTRVEAR